MSDTRRIGVDGASIAYVDTGSPRPGAPTILLAHGFPLTHAMWRAQVEGLRAECRVVAPDLRGYGGSTLGGWPAAEETPSLVRYADDVAALRETLDPDGPVVYVGFSMGGYVAFPLLERHGDRFDALVLMDTRAVADDEAGRATRLKMVDKIGEWGAARVAELMRPKLFAPGTPEAIVDEVSRAIAATKPATIAASQRAMAARPDSSGRLASIDLPTLVVCGADDAISPSDEMQTIAEAIPGARLVEIAGAGHMAPVEQPDAVNAALADFARGLAPGP